MRSTSGDGDPHLPGTEASPEDENPGPVCPSCRDTGWISRRVPVTHPDFGEVFACRCREQELRNRSLDHLQRYSNLGPLKRMTFESLDLPGTASEHAPRGSLAAVVQAGREFADNPEGWLVLTGPTSSGKTHLASAIANRCIEKGRTLFFTHVSDLLDHLRATFSPDSPVNYDDIFQQVRDVPILVLDDLGSQSSTPWAQEKLFQVINHRFNAELPTIITLRGNLSHLDEGLRSRLTSSRLSRIYSLGAGTASSFQDFGGMSHEVRNRMTFENFDTSGMNAGPRQRESLKAVLGAARNYSADPHGWLFLLGENGCGKTHLAVAIVNELLARSEEAIFAFVPALLDHLRAAFGPNSQITYDERFEAIKSSPFLVLDDLGAQSSTPWAEEKLLQIIVHRQNGLLPTVITAAEDLFSLPVSSRLSDNKIVQKIQIDAPDYRFGQGRARPRGRPGRS